MLDSPPASWDALQDALKVMPAEAVQEAIVIQLEHQPSADVYNFLMRTLDLCRIRMITH